MREFQITTCRDCRPGQSCDACRGRVLRDGEGIRVPMTLLDSTQREIAQQDSARAWHDEAAAQNRDAAQRQLAALADHRAAVERHAARFAAEREAQERAIQADPSTAAYARMCDELSKAWRAGR